LTLRYSLTPRHQHPSAAEQLGLSRLVAGLDALPAIVFVADRDQRVVAASAKAREAVAALGYATGDLVGETLARVHGSPDGLAQSLTDGSKAHEHKFKQNGKVFKATIRPLSDGGAVTGYAVSWEDQTRRSVAETELGRVLSMLESLPTSTICADPDLTMRYVNPAGKRSLEALKAVLPFGGSEIDGHPLPKFFDRPDEVAAILVQPQNLPYRARVVRGTETIDLLVSATYDYSKVYIGPMLTWDVVTERVSAEQTIARSHERESHDAAELRNKVDALLAVVSAAAEGDLTRPVTVQGSDAIGQLGEGLSRLLSDLRTSVGGIAAHAGTLASASTELTAISGSLQEAAEVTTQQAEVVALAAGEVSRNVQTVAAGSEEMGSSIREIARNAADAARVASEAVQLVDRTNTVMAQLGESSQEIGKVLKLITAIAQQTNLLALNATIEAARAGEAGKGFAVVAKEVKELARETARATEDIGQRVSAIQNDSGRATTAIREIGGTITRISDIQTAIAGAVEEQTATTSEMGRNISEGARATQEISQTIGGVAQAAKRTSDGGANVRDAVTDLARLATDLHQLIGRFTY
jgi:methyl-accepting chemotaxis protein